MFIPKFYFGKHLVDTFFENAQFSQKYDANFKMFSFELVPLDRGTCACFPKYPALQLLYTSLTAVTRRSNR